MVDFYCPQARLIVEVDGECHAERQVEDARRTARLESRGYRVIRFQATEIPPPARDRATSPARGEGLRTALRRGVGECFQAQETGKRSAVCERQALLHRVP